MISPWHCHHSCQQGYISSYYYSVRLCVHWTCRGVMTAWSSPASCLSLCLPIADSLLTHPSTYLPESYLSGVSTTLPFQGLQNYHFSSYVLIQLAEWLALILPSNIYSTLTFSEIPPPAALSENVPLTLHTLTYSILFPPHKTFHHFLLFCRCSCKVPDTKYVMRRQNMYLIFM